MAIATSEIVQARTSARADREACVSERMFEPQKWNEAFAAECEIEPAHEDPIAVEAEPDTIRRFDIGQRELGAARGDLADIDEDRAIQSPPGFPAVLRRDQHAVLIAEAELTEPAQRLRPAERGLVVQRHLAASAGVGEYGSGVKRQRAIAVRQRDVMLNVQFDASEIERARILRLI